MPGRSLLICARQNWLVATAPTAPTPGAASGIGLDPAGIGVKTAALTAAIIRVLGAAAASALSAEPALLKCLVRAIPAPGTKSAVANAPGISSAAYLRRGGRNLDNRGARHEHQTRKHHVAHVSLHCLVSDEASTKPAPVSVIRLMMQFPDYRVHPNRRYR